MLKKVFLFIVFLTLNAAASTIDKIENTFAAKSLSPYQHNEPLSGNISTVGSDTLARLMTQWARLFKLFYPAVNIQIQTSGSASAVPALIESTAQIGVMSRAIRDNEIYQFEQKYGYPPQAIKVAIDAIALFVNQDNPIKSIELAQVDAMYSKTQSCAQSNKITQWGELGLTGNWQHRRIQLFGRNSISGTYAFFKQQLLCGGDFRANVNQLVTSSSVMQAVSTSLNSIGYAGIGDRAAKAKMLPLNINGQIIPATVPNLVSGAYPLTRYLYVYLNYKPEQGLVTKETEFIKLMLSKQGQDLVAAQGFVPLPKELIEQQLQRLGIN